MSCHVRNLVRVTVILTSLLGISCGSSPLFPSQTETFAGTLTPQGVSTHTFTVAQNGAARVTIVSLAPSSSTVGVGAGIPENGGCALTVTDISMGQGETLTVELGAGTACVSIYDAGSFSGSEPLSYVLEVVHV